jgi:hypothetical protein
MMPEDVRTKRVSYLLRQEAALEAARAANASDNHDIMEYARVRAHLRAKGKALRKALDIAGRALDSARELQLETEANLAAFTSFEADINSYVLPPRGEDPAPVTPAERKAAMCALYDAGTAPQAYERDLLIERAIHDRTALKLEEERQAGIDLRDDHERLREDIHDLVEERIALDYTTDADAVALEAKTSVEGE